MIVTFKTKGHANVMMFGDIALQLIKLMGHSETVPSAIYAEDIPAAIASLKAGVAAHSAKANNEKKVQIENNDGQAKESVSLHNRALPLIELLQAAQNADSYVIWDKE